MSPGCHGQAERERRGPSARRLRALGLAKAAHRLGPRTPPSTRPAGIWSPLRCRRKAHPARIESAPVDTLKPQLSSLKIKIHRFLQIGTLSDSGAAADPRPWTARLPERGQLQKKNEDRIRRSQFESQLAINNNY